MTSQKVAKLDEIPVGSMKNVKVFHADVLLSNVSGKIYATANQCGHQKAPLHKGTLNGNVVTCPLHSAQFDVTTGEKLRGAQFMMPDDVVQKLPQEMLAMFKKTGEIISEIPVEPLKTFKVNIQGNSIFVEDH